MKFKIKINKSTNFAHEGFKMKQYSDGDFLLVPDELSFKWAQELLDSGFASEVSENRDYSSSEKKEETGHKKKSAGEVDAEYFKNLSASNEKEKMKEYAAQFGIVLKMSKSADGMEKDFWEALNNAN